MPKEEALGKIRGFLNKVDFDWTWNHEVNQAQGLAGDRGSPVAAEQWNLGLGVLFSGGDLKCCLKPFLIRTAEELIFLEVRRWEPVLAGDFNSELAGDELRVADLVVADTRWSKAKAGGLIFPCT